METPKPKGRQFGIRWRKLEPLGAHFSSVLLFLLIIHWGCSFGVTPTHAESNDLEASALAPVSISSFAIDPTNSRTLFAGSDGGGVSRCSYGDTSWVLVSTGLKDFHVHSVVLDPVSPRTLYAGTNGGVFKTSNGGKKWKAVNSGLKNLTVHSIAMVPEDPQVLYAGTAGGMFKSSNAGKQWTAVNSGLKNLTVRSVAVDSSTPLTLYAGTAGGVFKSINGGQKWSQNNAGLKNLQVQAVAIDPSDCLTLYAGTEGGVFKSTNAGKRWEGINSGLANLHTHSIAVDPRAPNILHAGTEGGIFKSTNGGKKWWTMIHLLHSFAGGKKDGRKPQYNDLVQDGSILYGMTPEGGSSGKGVIFRINADGSDYRLLHSFAGNAKDGARPCGRLILSHQTLYGMTTEGGSSNYGTIFKIKTDGSGFALLHSFTGFFGSEASPERAYSEDEQPDGAYPYGGLTFMDRNVIGMTRYGGNRGKGMIFAYDLENDLYYRLHSFEGGSADGAFPQGDLIVSGNKIFGMTLSGGTYDKGVIFQVSGMITVKVLHSFAGGDGDGAYPFGSLTLSGSVLYGMTYHGGASDSGVIFKIKTDGRGRKILHSFTGADGEYPYGSLTLSGTTLYGMTSSGGSAYMGVIFKMNTSGANFTLLHSFQGGSSDGAFPYGSLTLSDSSLSGMTTGGDGTNNGVVFQIKTDGTNYSLLHSYSGNNGADGAWPHGNLTLQRTTFYGMACGGGGSGKGAIFKVNTNGSGHKLLHSFDGSDGEAPSGSLTRVGSALYGMTFYGGSSDQGVIFRINTNGTGFRVIHTFKGGNEDGARPWGSLTVSDSTLYGMTSHGGSADCGVIFKIKTDGSNFTLLHSFAGGSQDGAYPYGSLVLSDSTLYGMTFYGGSSGSGVIFRIETNGSGFALLHSFTGSATDGAYPYRSLVVSGSTLYGMTFVGGSTGSGVIFKIKKDGSDFTLLHSFAGVEGAKDGASPYGDLIISGSTLYGMTHFGGSSEIGMSGNGAIFKINTNGTGFALIYSFTGRSTDGAHPYGNLTRSGSALFGMTAEGGESGGGVIFRVY